MRIEGRVEGNYYIVAQGAQVMKRIPLDQARADAKLRKAIERNGWEKLNG